MQRLQYNGFDIHFSELSDPRISRSKLYPLIEILFVVLCGSICGAESWRDFVLFGKEKIDLLREYYPFENGIASKDTFARVFAILNPEEFKSCFVTWVKSLQTALNDIIAIDGKTLRGSVDMQNSTSAIHMVSAFATGARLVLAQQKVADKSNEITAIPLLLNLLSLKGNIITIDAMGTQKAIAKQIHDAGGFYVLALKGNQGTLNEDVRLFLESETRKNTTLLIEDKHEDLDKGHGRIETRTCVVSSHIDWLTQKSDWAGLKTIAMIEEQCNIKGKLTTEQRFFISNLPPKAQLIAGAVRSHWMVENNLHWTLDVVFNEDLSRVHKEHASENMAIVRHIVLNMLNQAKSAFKGVGLKALRKKAGWGNNTLSFILKQSLT